ncbi:MAG TPA: hypothetical protein VHR45_23190 [Thermoanaerobaculia bacterium]|nr:hypothetical protein [Thermoanaerobaculia bacterium]
MTTQRLKPVARLSGPGLIFTEGQEKEGTPVNYELEIQRWMITPMQGDHEHAAKFEVSAVSVSPPLVPDPNLDYLYLQLEDRTRIKVYFKGTVGGRSILEPLDVSELVKKYDDEDC